MLSATYFLAAVSIEQQNTRRLLSEFDQTLQCGSMSVAGNEDGDFLGAALEKLARVDHCWRARKAENHLIPAMQGIDSETDAILGHLAALGEAATGILVKMQGQLENCFALGVLHSQELFCSMKEYVGLLQSKLSKEESDLFPQARKCLSLEAWFQIAAGCLASQTQGSGKPKSRGFSLPRPANSGVMALHQGNSFVISTQETPLAMPARDFNHAMHGAAA